MYLFLWTSGCRQPWVFVISGKLGDVQWPYISALGPIMWSCNSALNDSLSLQADGFDNPELTTLVEGVSKIKTRLFDIQKANVSALGPVML